MQNTLRSLAKSPLFTLAAIATLALGIGANTAVFSVLHSVVLAPLAYPGAERMVMLPAENRAKGIEGSGVTPEDIGQLRADGRSFQAVAGMQFYYYNVTGISAPVQVTAGRTTEDYFKVYGVAPALGRTWEPRDCLPGAPAVAVIGHSLWTSRLGADPKAVGRTILLDDKPTEVIGVMPARFSDLFGLDDVWVPVALATTEAKERGDRSWRGLARLQPGADFNAARTELQALSAVAARTRPETNDGWSITLGRAQDSVLQGIDAGLLLLGGAGACLLLITCANVGGLVLARAQTRRREIAIRTALGATRGDLLRQFLAEGLVLAVVGGALGAWLAWVCVPLLVQILPSWFPRSDEIAVNATALTVNALVSTLTGVLFGLLPVLQQRRSAQPGRDLSARGSEAPAAGRARSGLMIAEIALSVVLLSGAGLMIRSFLQIQQVSPGIQPKGVTAMVLNLSPVRHPDRPSRRAFYDAMLERVRAVPGVTSASITRTTPFTWGNSTTIEIDGRPPTPGETQSAYFDSIDPAYLRTMGMQLRAGRDLLPADSADAPLAVLINEAMAKKYFPDTNPVGRTLRLSEYNGKPVAQIVGVVGDVKRFGLTSATPLQMYASYQQLPPPFATLMLRSAPGSSAGVVPAVQKAIWSVNPDQPIGQVIDMETLVNNSVGVPRLGLILFATFAGVALLLAAVGLYGLLAYSVGARTREIGIRMALGAQAREIVQLILREGGVLVGAGLVIGMVAALALARLMSGLVFGISPSDPLSFALVVPLLALVALGAIALPARRATRIDPNVALRAE